MTKCSAAHIQEYKNAINNYLKSKNITDYSKYKILFKEDKLHIDLWNYPSNIERPLNITPTSNQSNNRYYETQTRSLIIQVDNNSQTLYIDAEGNFVTENTISKNHIDAVIRTESFINNKWLWVNIETLEVLSNGVLKYARNVVGKHKFIILYR